MESGVMEVLSPTIYEKGNIFSNFDRFPSKSRKTVTKVLAAEKQKYEPQDKDRFTIPFLRSITSEKAKYMAFILSSPLKDWSILSPADILYLSSNVNTRATTSQKVLKDENNKDDIPIDAYLFGEVVNPFTKEKFYISLRFHERVIRKFTFEYSNPVSIIISEVDSGRDLCRAVIELKSSWPPGDKWRSHEHDYIYINRDMVANDTYTYNSIFDEIKDQKGADSIEKVLSSCGDVHFIKDEKVEEMIFAAPIVLFKTFLDQYPKDTKFFLLSNFLSLKELYEKKTPADFLKKYSFENIAAGLAP